MPISETNLQLEKNVESPGQMLNLLKTETSHQEWLLNAVD